jgi:hypothetical protein
MSKVGSIWGKIQGRIVDITRAFRDLGYHLDVIISSHALVHTGMTYSTGLYNEVVADDGTLELSILTGANYEAHLEIAAQSGGSSLLSVFEGRTVSGGGAVTPRNKNRSITTSVTGGALDPDAACQETVTSNPVSSTGGTTLQAAFLLGGTGPLSGGASASSRAEWILKRSTQYTVILQNLGGGNKAMALALEWYEHPANYIQYPEDVT